MAELCQEPVPAPQSDAVQERDQSLPALHMLTGTDSAPQAMVTSTTFYNPKPSLLVPACKCIPVLYCRAAEINPQQNILNSSPFLTWQRATEHLSKEPTLAVTAPGPHHVHLQGGKDKLGAQP